MTTTRTRLGRRVPGISAVVVAGALALGALVGFAPAASAEQTGGPIAGSGVATWGVSDYLNAGTFGRPSPWADGYTAPSTYDATSKLSTWGNGSGTVEADGSADLSFEGATVNWAKGTGNGWLRLADVEVELDATGAGEVTAEVSYGTTPTGDTWTDVPTTRGPQRIPVVDLSVSPQTGDANYPTAISEVAYAFDATAAQYTWSGLKGRWSDELTAFLNGDAAADPAIPAWTFKSTVVNNVVNGTSRYPSLFSFSIERAVAETSAMANLDEDGVSVDVAGAGFLKTAPGVYVSLRERTEGDAEYAGGSVTPDRGTVWVSNDPADITGGELSAAAAITEDGSFTTEIRIAPEDVADLDPAKDYTIVTRKAHGMGSLPAHASQVTETAVELAEVITAAQAREATTTTAAAAPVKAGQNATVNITVTGAGSGVPTGDVKLLKAGTQVGAADLVGGQAAIPVAGLPVGTSTLAVAYQGSAGFWKSATTVQVSVTKIATTTAITVIRKPTSKVPGRIGVVVKPASGGYPAGKVDVILTKGSAVKGFRGLTLSSTGRLLVTLPSTGKGTWTLKVTYKGSATHSNSAKAVTLRVTS